MKSSLVIALLLISQIAHSQSFLGAWHSTDALLISLKFSLTFYETEYQVDCTLGQTIGTYDIQDDKIHFTPTKIGIDSGEAGKRNVWTYERIDDDSFNLTSGPIKVKFVRGQS